MFVSDHFFVKKSTKLVHVFVCVKYLICCVLFLSFWKKCRHLSLNAQTLQETNGVPKPTIHNKNIIHLFSAHQTNCIKLSAYWTFWKVSCKYNGGNETENVQLFDCFDYVKEMLYLNCKHNFLYSCNKVFSER